MVPPPRACPVVVSAAPASCLVYRYYDDGFLDLWCMLWWFWILDFLQGSLKRGNGAPNLVFLANSLSSANILYIPSPEKSGGLRLFDTHLLLLKLRCHVIASELKRPANATTIDIDIEYIVSTDRNFYRHDSSTWPILPCLPRRLSLFVNIGVHGLELEDWEHLFSFVLATKFDTQMSMNSSTPSTSTYYQCVSTLPISTLIYSLPSR